MSIRAVLGCIYGDEAKAKIVDVLAPETDIIIRFQGGSNAGHTIVFDGQKFVMHLIPSGIFHPQQICGLASGVVIDPVQLDLEIKTLSDKGISFDGRFFIDERASLVLPIHKLLDERTETWQGEKNIGTTRRGIGPCYADSISRFGIKLFDLYNRERLSEKIDFLYKYHNQSSEFGARNAEFGMRSYELDGDWSKPLQSGDWKSPLQSGDWSKPLLEYLLDFGQRMKNYLINLPYKINDWIGEGKNILFEGAQGTLLDVYFGTYPYVTSSHTIAGGIAAAVGFSPKKIDEIIGVYKSYFTRVGSGPFPTELFDETGEQIRRAGNEFGATTGRPRRCGWFDMVSAKYSAMINGVDSIALTLLDVLSGIETIKICVEYKRSAECGVRSDDISSQWPVASSQNILESGDWKSPLLATGNRTQNTGHCKTFPADTSLLSEVKPVYIEMEGWKEDISECKSYAELPIAAQKYVAKIQELMGIPVKIISVGPDRKQTIVVSG